MPSSCRIFLFKLFSFQVFFANFHGQGYRDGLRGCEAGFPSCDPFQTAECAWVEGVVLARCTERIVTLRFTESHRSATRFCPAGFCAYKRGLCVTAMGTPPCGPHNSDTFLKLVVFGEELKNPVLPIKTLKKHTFLRHFTPKLPM